MPAEEDCDPPLRALNLCFVRLSPLSMKLYSRVEGIFCVYRENVLLFHRVHGIIKLI